VILEINPEAQNYYGGFAFGNEIMSYSYVYRTAYGDVALFLRLPKESKR